MKPAATNDRNFRTFLLVSQLEAKAIGMRIAQARNEAGMTQEDVADVATFSKRSLQDYEAGVTIPYKHLREIGRILKREVPWFLHGEPQREADDVTLSEIARRLESLEEQVAESVAVTKEALRLLRAARRQAGEAPRAPRQANG